MSAREMQHELVAALLREQSTLALSTVDAEGTACAAPLFYIANEDLTLHWLSSTTSEHSVNLLRQPRAAIAVYRDTDHWKKICGVQMRGAVAEVVDPIQRKHAIERYCERFQLGAVFRLAISQSALYAFHPTWIRYIDNAKHFGYTFEMTLEA